MRVKGFILQMNKGTNQGIQSDWLTLTHQKGRVTFLMILVVVSLLLVGVRSTFTGSMVIYAHKGTSDSMQVFFPIDGLYSEGNSVRSAIVDNPANGISIPLPRASVDHVRIDPANVSGNILITKIEMRYLLSTEVLMPSDLVTLARPLQMIDKMELGPSGFLMRSTGNDPAFTLQLDRPSNVSQFTKLGIISLFFSLAVFLVVRLTVRQLIDREMPMLQERRVFLVAVPLLLSLGVTGLFYPGFMSYDTLHALRGARNGVSDSMWPPMVSYIWRTVDLISLNPFAMHFSQVALLMTSVFLIMVLATKKISYATIFLVFYLRVPAAIGTMAEIWKDVLMAAFFLAGFVAIMSMKLVVTKRSVYALSLLAVTFIFLGTASRHNAITAAVPMLFYLMFIVCSRFTKKPFYLWLWVILSGGVLMGAVYSAKIQLDNYSLPGFEKMTSQTDKFIQSVRILDVAGASLCLDRNLFGNMAPNLSVAEIRELYDPRHISFSRGLLNRVGVDSRINDIWLDVAIHHPVCFVSNKLELTKYMIGANEGAQFLITHPYIDSNEYGYVLPTSTFREAAVNYITHASYLPFYRPWFLYMLSVIAFVYLIKIGEMNAAYLSMFLSAGFYFSSFVLFGNAADARLLFYTTTLLLIFPFVAVLEFKKKRNL